MFSVRGPKSALLSFHGVLHEQDSMTGNRVVTYIARTISLPFLSMVTLVVLATQVGLGRTEDR